MLVLSRNRFESIQIGEGIVIKIIEVGKKRVKIGISAPNDIRILRSELTSPANPAAAPLATHLLERHSLPDAGRTTSYSLTSEVA